MPCALFPVEREVKPLERAAHLPLAEIVVDQLPFGKVLWRQVPPLAPDPKHVKDRIYYNPQAVPPIPICRQRLRYHFPL
ncbi:hypothetical protein LN893_06830 [Pontibacter sp. XAAS-A31]|nr:hypothetical protein [Pontibacter harenae]MCC9166553.1 hypothetical protein [Pontibacter harenae]